MGLYDDDNAAVTTGDLAVRDYWRAKFNDAMLDQSIKTRQPEGAIGLSLVSAVQLLDDLLKAYPNHADLKKWREHALAVQKKIGPDFSRTDGFTQTGLWNQHSYQEAYVGIHCGKLFAEQGNWAEAHDCYRTAAQKLKFLEDRIVGWPADVAAWIKEQRAQVDGLVDEAYKKK